MSEFNVIIVDKNIVIKIRKMNIYKRILLAIAILFKLDINLTNCNIVNIRKKK